MNKGLNRPKSIECKKSKEVSSRQCQCGKKSWEMQNARCLLECGEVEIKKHMSWHGLEMKMMSEITKDNWMIRMMNNVR